MNPNSNYYLAINIGFPNDLRQVIGLRGYGQRDPLNEYTVSPCIALR
jgi:hypothetical protein